MFNVMKTTAANIKLPDDIKQRIMKNCIAHKYSADKKYIRFPLKKFVVTAAAVMVCFLWSMPVLAKNISEFYNSHGNKKNSYLIESNPIVIADLELIGFKSIPIYEILELETTKNKEV